MAKLVFGMKLSLDGYVDHEGEIDVGGPALAQASGEAGLIDEYRLYHHPVVPGSGRPFFVDVLPRLRPIGSDRVGAEAIRLTDVPA